MNYLAHAHLTPAPPALLVGNMMGDFVKGRLDSRYPPLIRQGLQLHRQIDSFTDRHPQVQISRARVSAARRRYAGILADMFFDHLLARHWDRFADQALPEFAGGVYQTLEEHADTLPEGLRRALPYMRRENWLVSYREPANISRTLARISRQLTRENPLASGYEEFLAQPEAWEEDFFAFFPDLIRYTQEQLTS